MGALRTLALIVVVWLALVAGVVVLLGRVPGSAAGWVTLLVAGPQLVLAGEWLFERALPLSRLDRFPSRLRIALAVAAFSAAAVAGVTVLEWWQGRE